MDHFQQTDNKCPKNNSIIFHTPNTRLTQNLNFYLKNTKIERVKSVRFLGIVINKNLSLKPHMKLLQNEIRICTEIVKKIKSYLNMKVLAMLFNSMIISHLSFCNLIWCNGNKTALNNLQRTVNKFVRLIFYLNRSDSVQTVMQHNIILSIKQLLEFEIAFFMYKYIRGNLPLA